MCNAKALLTVVAVGAAVYTGGASLGLLGGEAGAGALLATDVGVGAAAAGGAGTGAAAGLTTAQTIALASSATSAGLSAASAYQQASTAKKIGQSNADQARLLAADALARGDKQAMQARQRGGQIESAQRAALSARGLDLSEGTPADILGQTDFFTQSDIATARTNGRREASAALAQSRSFQGQSDAMNPGLQMAGSLLGSGASVATRWDAYRKGA